ncbi:hypothetical protein GO988_21495 [Hymenobacter sp. HMF4947]|uniref:Uncharacterized protein n=1 Tax=Hymenobacter ginkgonis TaxID=2682976 RepID=A0A7K1TKL3_9BACT|nr:hypothetical protein [Hymenobacter ginkgonis]MVN78912.1 hypothetical protein [Hymenobacter ginkgonis]
MADTTSDSTLDKLKVYAFPAVLGLLNLVLTNQIKDAATEIKETRKDIIELNSTVQVQKVVVDYLNQRVTNLETAKKEAGDTHAKMDGRLNSLEQRAAIYDEYMSSHKTK